MLNWIFEKGINVWWGIGRRERIQREVINRRFPVSDCQFLTLGFGISGHISHHGVGDVFGQGKDGLLGSGTDLDLGNILYTTAAILSRASPAEAGKVAFIGG